MSPELRSYVAGTLGLAALLGVALLLTLSRPRLSRDVRARARASRFIAAALALQLLHFVEELRADFYGQFPLVLGLVPWSAGFFIWFNAAWFAVWIVAMFGLRAGAVPALFPLWFLGLAMLLNGVAHPILALRLGRYFPGLFTAPLVGVAGIVLLQQLERLTRVEVEPEARAKEETT